MSKDEEKRPITALIHAVNDGDARAYERLLTAVHSELHTLAKSYMRRERAGHTLQPTILVNEVYLQLAENEGWQNRAHFFGAAAQSMRRILVDHARARSAQKRGGDQVRVTLGDDLLVPGTGDAELVALDESLHELRKMDGRLVDVVELRFFAGLTVEEIAEALDIGTATVKRDWRYARSWLYDHMRN